MIDIAGKTDKGRVRANNEDVFVAIPIWEGDAFLAVVVDGMGGYVGGEVAAGLAAESIERYLSKYSNGECLTLIREAVTDANASILDAQRRDPTNREMSCVATACIVRPSVGKIFMAHVGDTRLYCFHEEILEKLSHDHSLIGYREERGDLSEEEAMRHPQRNEVSRTLGATARKADDEDFIESATFDLLPGATYLLCSDGLTDMLTTDGILAVLRRKAPLDELCGQLVDEANVAGGNDNITVVLLRDSGQKGLRAAEAPVPSAAAEPEISELAAEPALPPAAQVFPKALIAAIYAGAAAALVAVALCVVILFRFPRWPAEAIPRIHGGGTARRAPEDIHRMVERLQNTGSDTLSISLASTRTDTTIYLHRPILLYADSIHWIEPQLVRFAPADSGCRIGLIMTGRGCRLSNVRFTGFAIDTLKLGPPQP